MNLETTVAQALEQHGINSAEPIVVAVSGGLDSCALLHAVSQRHPPTQIHVAHLNHNLRGAASDSDAAFVMALAEKVGAVGHLQSAEIAKLAATSSDSIEMAGRLERYAFFGRIAVTVGATLC